CHKSLCTYYCLATPLSPSSFSLTNGLVALRPHPLSAFYWGPGYASSGSVPQLPGRRLEVLISARWDFADVAPTPPPSPPRDGRRNLTEQIGHSKGKGGVECSDVAVCLGTVITARPATDLTTQSRKHSRSISGSSGHSTNFQLEGEWRLWDLGARGFRLPYSLHIDIDSGKSLHFPVKKYWQRNSPGVPAGAKRNRKTNGSGPETATADGCHSPGDSATGIHGEGPTSSASLKDLESLCQELAVVLDSRSVKISQLNNIIKSLRLQIQTLSSVAVVENQQRPKSSVLGSLRRVYQKEQKKQVQHQLEVVT
uniref:Uncharacterized protein n=1 Tax=Macaca fascicularis TaxID=9541 RepID=A0A7N9CVP2_MACFA